MEQQLFETNVVTGADLLALSENVRGWEKRDCYQQLGAYLHSNQNDRVCLLFGLRRTGKTTMLRQAVLDMAPEDAAKTAYIKATVLDTMAALNRDMKRLRAAGFRYVLLDEVTLIPEFIDSAALFSDIYAAQGKTFESREYLKSLKENYPGEETDIFRMIETRLNNQ